MTQTQMMVEVNKLLECSGFPWAVCGGFALDLFLNKDIRSHSDIDICVFEADRATVQQYMLNRDWTVYEFRGQGKVRLLDTTLSSEPGRNLMCLKDGCDIVRFYPCEEKGLLYHRFFHTGITAFHYLEFLFNKTDGNRLLFNIEKGLARELPKAILYQGGIPYLAPEIALLYKASNTENLDYQFDFEQVFPHLNDDQKEWFKHGIEVLYPNGHPWKK